jgi:glutamyl-tRNA synthetase
MGWDHHSALEDLAQRQQQIALASGASPAVDAEQSDLALSSTDIPDDGALLPPQTRSDSHSYYDIFTPGQLIAAFSLEHVNQKKAAVSISKLDFINKITLRRKADRLGNDGSMIKKGKEGLEEEIGGQMTAERTDLILRVQAALKEQKVLKDK